MFEVVEYTFWCGLFWSVRRAVVEQCRRDAIVIIITAIQVLGFMRARRSFVVAAALAVVRRTTHEKYILKMLKIRPKK